MNPESTQAAVQRMLLTLRRSFNVGASAMSDGTLLLGKQEARSDGQFSESYLHEIYAPLREREIASIPEVLGRPLPAELADFFRVANGVSLFCGSFSVRGFRPSANRNSNSRFPVSIAYGNSIDFPRDETSTTRPNFAGTAFGFYADGGGFETALLNEGRVVLVPRRRTAPVLRTWPSLPEFLDEKVDRLVCEYVSRKRNVDPLNVLPAPV